MKSKKRRGGIMLDIAVLILCLAVATSALASGMYAKFATKASSGSPLKAGVASLNVDAGLDKDAFTVDLNDGGSNTGEYLISLDNGSEVAVKYTVVLNFDADVSSFITPKLGEKKLIGASADGMEFKWTDFGSLDPDQTGISVPLYLEVGDNAPDDTYGFTVEVYFEQVD